MIKITNKKETVFTIQINPVTDNNMYVQPIASQTAKINTDDKIANFDAIYIQDPVAYAANRVEVRAALNEFTNMVLEEEAKLYEQTVEVMPQ